MQTTMYWLDSNVQLVYGCFRGNLEQFEAKVKSKHANNIEWLNEFLREIEIMKTILKLQN